MLKDLSEIVRNGVIALGILVGGIWTYIQFSQLLEEETARVSLERQQAELETALFEAENRPRLLELDIRSREDALRRRAVLDIEILVEDVVADNTNLRLAGAITIRNIGDTAATIELDPRTSTIEIVRLTRGNGSVRRHDRQRYVMEDHEGPVRRAEILVGRTVTLPFVFWVAEPGIYMLAFEAGVVPGSDTTEAMREQRGFERFVWQELRFISVEAPSQ